MSTEARTSDAPGPDEAWEVLLEPRPTGSEPVVRSGDGDLPDPTRRWLAHAVHPDAPTGGAVLLAMDGHIRLGPRWFGFRAEQILRPGVGFVWRPVVGGPILRFTGADLLVGSQARMEFRLNGLVPVVGATGEDLARSAAGRLAGETVVWAPQALTQAAGARWAAVDGDRAVVTVQAAGHEVDVEVTVDADGRLRSVRLDRWNGSATPPAEEPFGGPSTSERVTPDGVRISGSGAVGWGWGTPSWPTGEFFRYRVLDCTPIP